MEQREDIFFMEIKPEIETFAKIKVVGVGGSGSSTINTMIKNNIKGVEFVAINTDAQALHNNLAAKKIHIGKTITRGLGAGMNPEIGARAAEENQSEIREVLKDADMVFVTCGMGGGTGTGASPIVAAIARELGALTVAVVTRPFSFEGVQRSLLAEKGLAELENKVDTVIVIPNDRILSIIDKKTSLLEAFTIVDDVLRQGVQGISELVTVHGRTNVDFADLKAIMQDAGSALMGIGYGTGDNRAADAANAAISSPLLEQSIEGAKGVLFTVTASKDLGMMELHDAAKIITDKADPNAKIIYGTVIDDDMKDELKVTVVATGFSTVSNAKKNVPQKAESVSKFRSGMSLPLWGAVPQKEEAEQDDMFENKKRNPPSEIKPVNHFPKRVEPSVPEASEDLDIPAFIRKKMM